jgi:exodeoxyribonuclease VII large subunit
LLPKRIAVISASTSKGYADFQNVIDNNSWGYRFFHMLFPALLQGENAVESIIAQLRRIEKVKHHFDAVAIIRGGGGDIGLTCYNNYDLSKAIASFPVPVLTGIGHSTNETVTEMVSFKNAITPTELADYLVQQFHNFAVPLQKAREGLTDRCSKLIRDGKSNVLNTVRFFRSVTASRLMKSRNGIQNQVKSLILHSGYFLRRKRERDIDQTIFVMGQGSRQIFAFNRHEIRSSRSDLFSKVALFLNDEKKVIEHFEKNLDLLNPVNVLQRGYSITTVDGRALKSVDGIEEGSILKTILADGSIVSITSSKNKTRPS